MYTVLYKILLDNPSQVYKEGFILLQEAAEVQKVNLNMTSDIVFASTADPYAVLLTEEGQVVLLTFDGSRLVPTLTQLHKVY